MTGVQLVLASASPRRRELLEGAGFDVEVRPSSIDETVQPGEEPAAYVARLAREKAAAIRAASDEILIAADTVVVKGGEILGKPRDAADARAMLGRLAGLEHEVLTGYSASRGTTRRGTVVRSVVRFRELSDLEIDRYVSTGEPLDKAGAYGIQGYGVCLVESVRGSYTNVVGLPLSEVVADIRALTDALADH